MLLKTAIISPKTLDQSVKNMLQIVPSNKYQMLTCKPSKSFSANPQKAPFGGNKTQMVGLSRMTKINIALSFGMFLGTSMYLYFNKKTKEDNVDAQKKAEERMNKEKEMIQRDIKYLQELAERRKQKASSMLGKGDNPSG